MGNKRAYHGATADPVLASIAHGLERVYFPIEDSHRERYKDLLKKSPGDNFRNTIPRGNKAFGVRLFLGGKNRIIGLCSRHIVACRFADMALRRFWVYRVRNAAPPIDADLNFGTDSAQWDEDNLPEAVTLLDVIEEHLVRTGVFPCAIKTEEQRKAIHEQRLKRRTMRGDMSEFREGIAFELEKLGTLITRLEQKHDETFKRIEDLIARAYAN